MLLSRLKAKNGDDNFDLIVWCLDESEGHYAVQHAGDQCAGVHHFFYAEDYYDGHLGARRAAQHYMLLAKIPPCREGGGDDPCDDFCKKLHPIFRLLDSFVKEQNTKW